MVRRGGVTAAKAEVEVLLRTVGRGFGEVPAAVVLERARDGTDAAHDGDVAEVASDAVVVVEDFLYEDRAFLARFRYRTLPWVLSSWGSTRIREQMN